MLKLYGFSKVNAGARGHTRDLRVLWALVYLAKKSGRLIPGDRAGEAQVMRWCCATGRRMAAAASPANSWSAG